MEHSQENDLARIHDLLSHTSEFIAYFELAETKMIEWRADIMQQTELFKNEMMAINKVLSAAGTTNFRQITERALNQGEKNLELLERNSNQFMHTIQNQQEHLRQLTEKCIKNIEHHSAHASSLIAAQLAKYDVHQFHRIATESCDHVERVANDAVSKSNKLLSMFQLRLGLFAVLTTILTSFVIVLYLSDELPWEMHHQAMNERQAGKVLLNAWPKLTQEEKAKILNDDLKRA
ncbi:MAG TPA: hypothetical protein PK657_07230 [Legionella sp.]|nr:hypothetical protein [Legionella sp.]